MSDIFECFPIQIDDQLLLRAQIAAWMFDQHLETLEGKKKPFAPKSFPKKAVDIIVKLEKPIAGLLEIYLDSTELKWNSKVVVDHHFGKLTPEQLDQFFKTRFYQRMLGALAKKWPLTDPMYGQLFDAVKQMNVSTEISEEELEQLAELDSKSPDEVDQTEKSPELANQDTTGDGKRDYSGSGRKIQNFSDVGVKNGSGRYFCWPRPGKEFKWNTWKDWHKLKPFCKMSFVHNGRSYMISLSLFDEEFDNRGFKGADTKWTPPLAWLTHEECSQIMQLTIVRKFLKQCQKRIKQYLDMTPEEVLAKIDKPERLDVKEIEKTQRVIKHCTNVAFRDKQADNFKHEKQ